MYRVIHVYDLDGILVDSSHRYRNKADGTIDLDYWFSHRTPDNIAKDRVLPLVKKYRRDLSDPRVYVIICTSRSYTPADETYINTRLGKPNKLIMRKPGNTEADGVLKRRELSRLFNLRQFFYLPRFFWEDNKKNIAACESLFTRCFLLHSRIC